MSNFRFIDKNIDVSKIVAQLKLNWDDWKAVSRMSNTGGDKNPSGFLPITMAYLPDASHNPKNCEETQNTPWYNNYTAVIEVLNSYGIYKHSRAAFLLLRPGGSAVRHVDEGTYYLTRDRYHLSISGRYLYEVGGEEHIIEPGTLFWFNNKKPHSAKVIGNEDRITFVFDVPHSDKNP